MGNKTGKVYDTIKQYQREAKEHIDFINDQLKHDRPSDIETFATIAEKREYWYGAFDAYATTLRLLGGVCNE